MHRRLYPISTLSASCENDYDTETVAQDAHNSRRTPLQTHATPEMFPIVEAQLDLSQ
jgi:hypothetical protein